MLGAILMELLEQTKSSQHAAADVVVAYTTYSGLSLGNWLALLSAELPLVRLNRRLLYSVIPLAQRGLPIYIGTSSSIRPCILVKHLATLSYNSLKALIDLQSPLLSGVLTRNDAQVAPTCLKSAFLPTVPPFLLRLLNTAAGI
jgi:hypothetical protein